MRPKKSFGQHFLNNEKIARRIVAGLTDSLDVDAVLEIGPGKGVLTKYLLEGDFEFKAVEADRDMVAFLSQKYPLFEPNLIYHDILKVEIRRVFDRSFAVIGNFPYNISSQILFKILDNRQLIPLMVGMFQKEVAERVVSKPGSKVYGVTSVLIQAFYEATYLFGVDKQNFSPPPKVQSAVIRLKIRPEMELGCDEKLFRQIVKITFGQRRKMLRNTLKPFVKGREKGAEDWWVKRPEQLGVQEFVQLTRFVEKLRQEEGESGGDEKA